MNSPIIEFVEKAGIPFAGDDGGSSGSPPVPERPGFGRQPAKVKFDGARLQAYVAACGWPAERANALELGLRSAREPVMTSREAFLEALYARGERVLVLTRFISQGDFLFSVSDNGGAVARLSDGGSEYVQGLPEGGADGVWFLANPVDGEWHPVPNRERGSRRSGSAVTAWRYLVLESDEAYPREWLQVLMTAPLRIAAIYTSGGKSIHALVRVDARTKGEFDAHRAEAMRVLVAVGADPMAISGVRLTRLPWCLRGKRMQRLLYLCPAPTGLPICEMSPRVATRSFFDMVRGQAARLMELSDADRELARRVCVHYGRRFFGADWDGLGEDVRMFLERRKGEGV